MKSNNFNEAQFENPAIRLKKLTEGVYDYSLIIEGKNEETRLSFEVTGFPTTGTYHLKFKNAHGMDRQNVSHFLKFDEMIFKTSSILENPNSVKISLTDVSTNITYELDNILFVLKDEIDNSITEENIMQNETFKKIAKQKFERDSGKSKGFGFFKFFK